MHFAYPFTQRAMGMKFLNPVSSYVMGRPKRCSRPNFAGLSRAFALSRCLRCSIEREELIRATEFAIGHRGRTIANLRVHDPSTYRRSVSVVGNLRECGRPIERRRIGSTSVPVACPSLSALRRGGRKPQTIVHFSSRTRAFIIHTRTRV